MASLSNNSEIVIPVDNSIPHNQRLMTAVKRHLNITWNDEDTDSKLSDMIDDAVISLNHQLGVSELDYLEPGAARRLFMNYMLYAWNDSLDEFDHAYISEIIKLRAKYAVLKRTDQNEKE